MEREKTLMKTKQLELKEIATMEKLRELKQILKMSQRCDHEEPDNQDSKPTKDAIMFVQTTMNGKVDEKNSCYDKVTSQSSYYSNVENGQPNSKCDMTLKLQSKSNHNSQSFDAENMEKSPWVGNAHGSVDGDSSRQSRSQTQFSTTISGDDVKAEMPGNDMTEGDEGRYLWAQHLLPESKSDSGFSEKTFGSHQSYSTTDLPCKTNNLFQNGQTSQKPSHVSHSSSSKDINQSNNSDIFALQRVQRHRQEEQEEEDVERRHSPTVKAESIQTKVPFHSLRNDSEKTTLLSSQIDIKSSNDKSRQEPSSLLKLDDMEGFNASDILNSLKPSTIRASDSPEHGHSVLPPSEYINSMLAKEGFDARRMGLSSQNFESALSHMLNDEDSQVKSNSLGLPYESDPYEKYSRTSESTSRYSPRKSYSYESPYAPNYSTKKGKSMKYVSHAYQYKAITADKNPWGPETKVNYLD